MARKRCHCRPPEGLKNRGQVWAESVLLPVRQGCPQSSARPAVWPAGYRHQRANRPEEPQPSGTAARLLSIFHNQLIPEGLHHASDTGFSACLFSCAGANAHGGRHPICRLAWRVGRHQSPAGQPLSAYRPAPVPFSTQPQRRASGILVRSMMQRLEAPPPWTSSASAA
jgi:hypothetical protein